MNKRQILSWCFYDFANSSYSAVIAAVIFPVFYAKQIVGNDAGLGDLWWGRAIALSMGFVALSSPFLGGIAGYAGLRKKLLFLYTIICVVSVSLLYSLKEGMALEGFLLIVAANIGMEGGLVFYNSFLPDIASRTHQGRISAWGFAIGYVGSIVSLIIALFLINNTLVNMVWPMVALFFLIFSLPAFLYLPKDKKNGADIFSFALGGVRQTIKILKEVWTERDRRGFLLSYLLYEDGVNTVIVFSSIFAATTLNFKPQELVYMYLLVQVTALIGSFSLARPIDSWGPKEVLKLSLLMWMSVSIAAFFVDTKTQFFFLASVAGLGLGVVQAASRAFYAGLIPRGRESEYFGIYSLVGKSSAVLGPLLFGLLSSTLGSQRPAVLSIALFFIAGFLIVRTVKGGEPNI